MKLLNKDKQRITNPNIIIVRDCKSLTTDGACFGTEGTDQDVFLSGKSFYGLTDTDGNPLRDDPADILAHELVGHAIPKTIGTDTGNAVKNENKVRSELKEGKNQQRAEEVDHVE